MPVAVTLALIELAVTLLEQGPQAVAKIVADLQQSGELSDTDAEAFNKRMEDAFASDAWKPDANTGGGA